MYSAARRLIEDSFEQACRGYYRSVREQNADRRKYWKVRLPHLMSELNWVDGEIKKATPIRPPSE